MKCAPKELSAIYAKPLPSTRSGPLYNAFSYPTKISPESIAVFIATHTRPGATVLDIFGGSGTTGLAAQLCDKPTEAMIKLAAALGVCPQWGPRQAHIYELSSLGAFITKTLSSPPDPDTFSRAATELLKKAEAEVGWLYETLGPEGKRGTIRYTIWSDVLICPHCQIEVTYWDATVRWNPLHLADAFECQSCRKKVQVDKCQRAKETVWDRFLGRKIERKKRDVARVFGRTQGTDWNRPPSDSDYAIAEQARAADLPDCAPKAEIVWGDLYRAGYHMGITHLHHFYTPRNFLAVAALWKIVPTFPEDIRDALRLLILSYNAVHSTLMTRVVVKKDQREFVLTGAQSGVLYVSGLPVEKNVFEGIRRKAVSLRKAFAATMGSRSQVRVVNASSARLDLPNESVDYIFTDPPFGGYIPYAEINQLNELWLGSQTDRSEEIIVSPAQGKRVPDYARMMTAVFQEATRVLKNDGLATVVFHSADSSVWQALIEAYTAAGLSVRATSVLDKLQTSFKQGVSKVSVKGDPIILLTKGEQAPIMRGATTERIASEILALADGFIGPERTPQRLYSRFVSRCLELGLNVDIGARAFYARAKAPRKG